jgi:hypothetical protein
MLLRREGSESGSSRALAEIFVRWRMTAGSLIERFARGEVRRG